MSHRPHRELRSLRTGTAILASFVLPALLGAPAVSAEVAGEPVPIVPISLAEALALAEHGGAEEGREALRVVRERRQAGMATLTDELETEAASLAAELQELRAATEAALADTALERASGGPHPLAPSPIAPHQPGEGE